MATLIQYRKANCVDHTAKVIVWSGGYQDVNSLPETFTLDDSLTAQLAAYDSCPWLCRAGGATSATGGD
jgi:hypothetical protein